MSNLVPLSVVVITKNEEERIADCLQSVQWAAERIVVDDFSTDRTVEIAHRYTDRVVQRKLEVEGIHRNAAYALASYPWILSLDADERVTPELQEELAALLAGEPALNGYTIPRRNFLGKHWIRYGGFYPSPQLKLFRKNHFRYEEVEVHPRAFLDSDTGSLRNDIVHYSYRNLEDFVAKLNRQTTLEAQKWVKDRRPMGVGKALWRTLDRSARTFWMKKGYREGLLGFILAALAGAYQFLSFSKYWHQKTSGNGSSKSSDASSPSHPFHFEKPSSNGLRATLSAVILTRNALKTIRPCLESLRWVDQIVVVDGGSEDGTLEAAQAAGAKIVRSDCRDDFGKLRNIGTEEAAGDWILQLDADEVVTADFRKALEEILRVPSRYAAYKFRRRNNFLGHWMRWGGWDHLSLHLFRKGSARYEGRVHEHLQVDGPIGSLSVGVEHHPFRSLEEFLDRQNRYTTLEALGIREQRGSLSQKEIRYQITVKPVKLFWKMYVKKGGVLEGMHGLIFSVLFSFVHFIKWAKVWELIPNDSAGPSS